MSINTTLLYITLWLTLSNPYGLLLKLFILYVLIISSRKQVIVSNDPRFMLVLLSFSIWHEVNFLFSANEHSIYYSFAVLLMPVAMYLAGTTVATKVQSKKSVVNFLLYCSVAYSVIPILSVLKDILENGFSIGTRSIELLWGARGAAATTATSATVIGGYLGIPSAGLALSAVMKKKNEPSTVFWISIILWLLSMACAVRLGNRTLIGVSVVILLFSLTINFKTITTKKWLVLSLLGIATAYYLNAINIDSNLLSYYADRIENDDFGVSSFGGRFQIWERSLNNLLASPFGWDRDSNITYSHNFWLDVARTSGLVGTLLLISINIINIRYIFKLYKIYQNKKLMLTYIISISISIYIFFFLEPIMEGFYHLFLFFCLLHGLIYGLVRRARIEPSFVEND